MQAQLGIGPHRTGLENSDRTTGPNHSKKIMRFVHVAREDGRIGLTPIEGGAYLGKAFRGHAVTWSFRFGADRRRLAPVARIRRRSYCRPNVRING